MGAKSYLILPRGFQFIMTILFILFKKKMLGKLIFNLKIKILIIK